MGLWLDGENSICLPFLSDCVPCTCNPQGKIVLEVGAGCGVAGLSAARLGASRVVLTEYSWSIIELLQENIEYNTLMGSTVETALLDFNDERTWNLANLRLVLYSKQTKQNNYRHFLF